MQRVSASPSPSLSLSWSLLLARSISGLEPPAFSADLPLS